MNAALGANLLSKHLEIAIYGILRFQHQLICVRWIVPEAPRGDILIIAVGGIGRTFDECSFVLTVVFV